MTRVQHDRQHFIDSIQKLSTRDYCYAIMREGYGIRMVVGAGDKKRYALYKLNDKDEKIITTDPHPDDLLLYMYDNGLIKFYFIKDTTDD